MVNADQLLDIITPRLKEFPPKSLSKVDLEILDELLDKFTFSISIQAAIIGFLALGALNSDIKKADLYVNKLLNIVTTDTQEIVKVTKNFDYFLNYLGQELINKNLTELARKVFRAALGQAKLENNTDTIATVSRSHAYAYYKDNDMQKSARLYEIASSLFTNPNDVITCLISAAILKYNAKDFLHAINILENALKVVQKLENNNTLVSELTLKLTDIQREVLLQGDLIDINTSFQYIQNIGQRLKALNQIKELAAFFYEVGIVLERLDYKDSALQYFEEASRIAYERELWPLYGRICLQLGLIAQTKQDFQISKSYFEQVIQIAEYLDDPELKSKGSTLIDSIEKLIELVNNPKNIQQSSSATSLVSEKLVSEPLHTATISSPELMQSTQTNNNIVPQESNPMTIPQSNQTQISKQQTGVSNISQLSLNLSSITQEKTSNVDVTGRKSTSTSTTSNTYEAIRNEIVEFLTRDGYSVQVDVVPFHGTSSVDIVASKGNIRRKKMFIMICANPEEAGISAYLLHNLEELGTKIIYLMEGNPLTVLTSPDVEIITKVQELAQESK